MKRGNSEDEIDLALNSYEDIFSSFDPRPYSERALSVDFLSECKRASADKTSPGLLLMLPKSKRDKKSEADIKQRLLEHFHKHANETNEEVKKIKREGILWLTLGLIIIIASVILHRFEGFVFTEIMFVFSWFFIWEGTAKIFIYAKEKQPDNDFYKKMSTARIEFIDRK
jgi:hypothetical protein